jgi:hypothetical protein
MNKTILILSSALFLGCAPIPSNEYTAWLSPALSSAMKQNVRDAISRWEMAVPVSWTILDQDSQGRNNDSFNWEFYPMSENQLISKGFHGDLGVTHWEIAPGDHGYIMLDDQLTDPWEISVMNAHELGHTMGLEHTGAGTLMFPSIGQGQAGEITCQDQEQYAHIRGQLAFCNGSISLITSPSP